MVNGSVEILRAVIRSGADYLERKAATVLDGDSGWAVAKELMAGLLDCPPAVLSMRMDQRPEAAVLTAFQDALSRFAAGEPLAYILGYSWFCGLRIRVGRGVLIPRPDTEVLVQQAVDCLIDLAEQSVSEPEREDPEPLRMLEVCTGSGCISLAVRDQYRRRWHRGMPALQIDAGDLDEAALAFARINVGQARADSDIHLFLSDLTQDLPEPGRRYDLLAANPPYIRTEVVRALDRGVRDFEPFRALNGGADGLDFYRRLLDEGARVLRPGGSMLLEHGYDQKAALMAELTDSAAWTAVRYEPDLSGRDRVLLTRLATPAEC